MKRYDNEMIWSLEPRLGKKYYLEIYARIYHGLLFLWYIAGDIDAEIDAKIDAEEEE